MEHKDWKRNFYIMWGGQAISVLTSSILQMVLIWNLTAATKSALVLSLASMAGFLPSAVLGLAAGTLVDRIERKTAIITADLFIAAVSLTLVFASLSGSLPVWLVLIVLAVRSVGTAFHTPAISAVTPLIVPTGELTKCAGFTQSLQTIGYLAGTAVAGVLYPVCSISQMVSLDVFGALFASLTVLCISIPKLEKKSEKQEQPDLLREMKEGYKILHMQKGLFALLWTAAIFMVLYSPISALYPLMSLEYFRGTTFQASIVEIAFSAGMLAGGVVISTMGGFKNRGTGIVFSVALMGIPIFLSGILPRSGFWGFVLCCAVMGLSTPFYNAPVTALMQERVAPEYLGRVFGLYGSIASLAMPVGLTLSGAFADKLGTNNWFTLTGILCIGLAVLMYMIPAIRKIDEENISREL